VVNNLLIESFADVIQADFTARMELGLDEVEQGKQCWTDLIESFFTMFRQDLERAETAMKNVKERGLDVSGEKCEHCGKDMVVKIGRFGQFLACSGYPECKNTKPLNSGVGVSCPAENCDGEVVERTTKRGRIFYACSRYPKCTFRSWDEPVAMTCPFCSCPYLVEGRGGGWKCPNCGKSVKKTVTEVVSIGDIPHELIKVRIQPNGVSTSV
jgi:DNA topoisomerase-1